MLVANVPTEARAASTIIWLGVEDAGPLVVIAVSPLVV